MKIIVAAFALAIATPAAAQTADHGQHQQHSQHQQGQHQQHQHGQRQQGQHGQHQGASHDCPCCQPAADGTRPACCERMHGQQGGRQPAPQPGHGQH